MPTVHHFNSTADAYDWSNVGETPDGVKINDGDVLVVESEGVVGILHRAWPVAVTKVHGSFHTLAKGVDWSCVGAQEEKTIETTIHPDGGDPYPHVEVFPADPGTDYTESVKVAKAIMARADRVAKVRAAADALPGLIAYALDMEAHEEDQAVINEAWDRVEREGATVHRQARILSGKPRGG